MKKDGFWIRTYYFLLLIVIAPIIYIIMFVKELIKGVNRHK